MASRVSNNLSSHLAKTGSRIALNSAVLLGNYAPSAAVAMTALVVRVASVYESSQQVPQSVEFQVKPGVPQTRGENWSSPRVSCPSVSSPLAPFERAVTESGMLD